MDTKTLLPDTCVTVSQARYLIENGRFFPIDLNSPFYFENVILLAIPMSFGLDPFRSVMIIQFFIDISIFYILLRIFHLLFNRNAFLEVIFSIFYFFFQYFIIYQFQFRQESIPILIITLLGYLMISYELKNRSLNIPNKEKKSLILIIILAYSVIFFHYLSAFFCFLLLLCYFILFPRNYPFFKILALIFYPICILTYWTFFFKYHGLIDLTNKVLAFSLAFLQDRFSMFILTVFIASLILILLIIRKKNLLKIRNNALIKMIKNLFEKIKVIVEKRLILFAIFVYLVLVGFIALYYAFVYDLSLNGIVVQLIQNIDLPAYFSLFCLTFILIITSNSRIAKIFRIWIFFSLFILALFASFFFLNKFIYITSWQFRFLFMLFIPVIIISTRGSEQLVKIKKKRVYFIIAFFSMTSIIGGISFLKKNNLDNPFNDYMTREEYTAGLWIDKNIPRNSCLILSNYSTTFVYAASSYPNYPPDPYSDALYNWKIFNELFGIKTYVDLKNNASASVQYIQLIRAWIYSIYQLYGQFKFYLIITERNKQDSNYRINYWMYIFENNTLFNTIYDQNTVTIIEILTVNLL